MPILIICTFTLLATTVIPIATTAREHKLKGTFMWKVGTVYTATALLLIASCILFIGFALLVDKFCVDPIMFHVYILLATTFAIICLCLKNYTGFLLAALQTIPFFIIL